MPEQRSLLPDTRRDLANDPLRPRYHFLPPANWLNDPNGLIQVGGLTHLFYQYNPNGAFHGTIHWGHAVSRDLVHWEDWPVALEPTPGGPDAAGCWSGCAVMDGETPTLFYTGVHPQTQLVATSSDGLRMWQKRPEPVIAAPPEGLEIVGPPDFRDPFVWREGERWRMVLGTGLVGEGGAVLLYESGDLLEWRYLGVLHRGAFAEDAEVWECPNFFKLGDTHVLLVSEQPEFRHTYYQLGTFENSVFRPETTGKTDAGRFFYAGLTMTDVQNRRLMWGWLREGRTDAAQRAAGWSGVMSLPRVLNVREERLEQAPIPELEALREDAQTLRDVRLETGERTSRWELPGNSYELALEVALKGDAAFALTLLESPDGREDTTLSYEAANQSLTLDDLRSSLDPQTEPERVTVDHRLEANTLRLRVFVDASIVEVFADKTTCLTGRVYPTLLESCGVTLTCLSGRLEVRELTLWPLKSIWELQS